LLSVISGRGEPVGQGRLSQGLSGETYGLVKGGQNSDYIWTARRFERVRG